MDQHEKQSLIARQLKDIISQADNILKGNDSNEAIEGFAKYSEELKKYLKEHSSNEMILERLGQLPFIDFKQLDATATGAILGSTIFGAVNALRNYNKKKRILGDVRNAQSLYSSIEFLFKSEMN